MGVSVRLDDQNVKLKLGKLLNSMKDTQPLADEIKEELTKYYSETVFETKGTITPWKDLAFSTKLSREKRWGYYKQKPAGNAGILVWTGNLQRGVKGLATNKQVVIYNDVEYFKYHQQGGGKLPRRPIFEITEVTVKTVTDLVINYYNNLLK